MVESAVIGLMEKFEDSNALNTSDTDSTFDKVQSAQWEDSEYRKDVQAGQPDRFLRALQVFGHGQLLQNYVAVKIIEKTRLSEKKQHVIQREVRILNSVHHPNIVRLFEFIVTFNRCYLVLELAQGENLHRLIVKQGALKGSDRSSMPSITCTRKTSCIAT
ncbi:Kinase domain protein [Aphelenchoides fujianensis]|nr:Kinase domain protein [Aphelenchoides fujianensis]